MLTGVSKVTNRDLLESKNDMFLMTWGQVRGDMVVSRDAYLGK